MTNHELLNAASFQYGFFVGSLSKDHGDGLIEIGRSWGNQFMDAYYEPEFELSLSQEKAAKELLNALKTEDIEWIDLFPRNILMLVGAKK